MESRLSRLRRVVFGWLGILAARILAARITELQLRPDPIEEPQNPFHALIPLDRFRERIHADNLAYRLANASEELGLIAPNTGNGEGQRSIYSNLWAMVRGLLARAAKRISGLCCPKCCPERLLRLYRFRKILVIGELARFLQDRVGTAPSTHNVSAKKQQSEPNQRRHVASSIRS